MPKKKLPELSNFEMLLDWYHQCRTCLYWDGDRKREGWYGHCKEKEITGMDRTTHCGQCPFWETFDEAALEKVKEWDKKRGL